MDKAFIKKSRSLELTADDTESVYEAERQQIIQAHRGLQLIEDFDASEYIDQFLRDLSWSLIDP